MPDLRTAANWTPLLSGVDTVVHTAAIAHTANIDDTIYDAVNAKAVEDLARAAHGRVERVVFLSSIRAQTGSSSESPLTELDQPHPTDAYGRSKLAAERALLAHTQAVVLRPVLVVGSNARGNLRTMLDTAALPLPLPFASLTARRSVVASVDLCRAISHVLSGPEHVAQTYIVAHPVPISVAEMFAALRTGLGRRPKLFPVAASLFRSGLRLAGKKSASDRLFGDLVASPSKLMGTGWMPKIAPHAALAEMAAARTAHASISAADANG